MLANERLGRMNLFVTNTLAYYALLLQRGVLVLSPLLWLTTVQVSEQFSRFRDKKEKVPTKINWTFFSTKFGAIPAPLMDCLLPLGSSTNIGSWTLVGSEIIASKAFR
jgi:hypothetical protein